MSGSVRKRIRLHVASMVDDVFHLGEAHPTRVLDGRDGKPYANVFFADGEAEYEDLYLQRSARLVVGIHLPWADNTDDDLDDFGDMIEDLFVQDSNIDLDNIVAGFVYAGFEYGEPDDSGYIRIYITFNVTY